MKDFFKIVLATFVGLVIFCIIASALSILSVSAMLASSSTGTSIKENSVFVLKLESVEERASSNPLASLGVADVKQAAGLDEILVSIRKASENDNIKGIYIEGTASTAMAPATAEAIRHALLQFKESGKFIISYADAYSRNAYYISSVADQVLLNPHGILEWNGMVGQVMYYKDFLDKIGVNFQVFKVGIFKSAVEPYLMNEMSDANREQISSYLNDIWQQTLKDVSASRNISVDSLNAYANKGLVVAEATEPLKLKLVDKLVYSEEVSQIIKEQMGLDENDDYHTLSLTDMGNVMDKPAKHKDGEIAVYYACGEIGSSKNYGLDTESYIDQVKVCRDLRKLRKDEDVKAVVLRVNSPGGSAYDSEQIWKEIIELKKEKPVVVSMSDYAASGGYYISSAANYILAEPTTITGSIGIFAAIPEGGELLNNKVGIHFRTVKTNEFSDLGDFSRPMNDAEKALIQNNINNGYELFTLRCANGRKMSQDAIKKIAEGRVWTGNQAIKNGLVDALGGLDEAIAKAKEMAEVEDCAVKTYPTKPGLFDSLLKEISHRSYADEQLKSMLGEYYSSLYPILHLKKQDYLQMRMPYFITKE